VALEVSDMLLWTPALRRGLFLLARKSALMRAMKRTNRIRAYILVAGICTAIGVLVFGALYQANYVVSGFSLVQGGSLELYHARPFSAVFLDNRRVGTIGTDGTLTLTTVRPGIRSLIVAHPGSWPWIFDVKIESSLHTRISPVQVPKAAAYFTLEDPRDPLREVAERELATYREPSRITPMVRNDTHVWVDGTTLYAQIGEEVHSVATSATPFRSVFWYENRDDAIAVATQNVVAVFDIRKNSIQNYFPLYTGSTPEAVANPDNPKEILIRDNGNIIVLKI